ncbi:transposase [Pseudomonas sp. NPDC089547]
MVALLIVAPVLAGAGAPRLCTKSNRLPSEAEILHGSRPSTERKSVMAKRYEISEQTWGVVSHLFIENHGRGRPRLRDRLTLYDVFWVLCSGAACRAMPERSSLWSTVVSTVSKLADSGDVRSNAQTLATENE